jgi:hypothetical protein
MPIEQTSRRYFGQELFVIPYYGNGWHREDSKPMTWDWEDMIGPESFNLLVEDFLELNKLIIGIRGKVKKEMHPYNGYWCLACLRSPDKFNFEDNPGPYMIWIARNEPQFSPAVEKSVYEYVTPDKSALCLCGYGTIADFPSRVQKYVAMALDNRESIKNEKTSKP